MRHICKHALSLSVCVCAVGGTRPYLSGVDQSSAEQQEAERRHATGRTHTQTHTEAGCRHSSDKREEGGREQREGGAMTQDRRREEKGKRRRRQGELLRWNKIITEDRGQNRM